MKLSDKLKTSCKNFKEVEQNFMKEFLVNKRKRFNTTSDTKINTVHLKNLPYCLSKSKVKI